MIASRRARVGAVLATATIAAAFAAAPAVAYSGSTHHKARHHAAGKSSKPPKSIAPTATAWFDTTRATAAAPGLPQSGVTKKDLVVDGLTVDTGQLPVSSPVKIPVRQEVAALTVLSFTLPKHTSAGTLRLALTGTTTAAVDGHLPGGVSPVACPTTSKWKKGPQQVGTAAPTYNCKKRSAVGQLGGDKQSVEFTAIGRLAQGRHLSFVILPGTIGLERLVFSKPGPDTLKLLSFGQTTTPPKLPTSPPSKPPASPGSNQSSGGGYTPPSGGSAGNLPPVSEGTVPKGTGVGTTPTVAPTGSAQPVAEATGAKPFDDHRARLAAIALLVGLVVFTAWLSITDGGGRTLNTLRILRAVQSGGPMPVIPEREWGIGRFRSPRNGPPPTI